MAEASYTKDPNAVLDYTINWADWLDSDTIASSSWAVTPAGLTIASDTETTTTTTVWLSGGTQGVAYTASNTIVTAGGRTEVRSITVLVGARAGMVELITNLRALTNAGTADYTLAGRTYWSDLDLERILDEVRQDVRLLPLAAVAELSAGSTLYHDYYIPQGAGQVWERADGGTAVWRVHDGTGTVQGTANYTVDYEAGRIRFTADTGGAAYYLDGRSYNMNLAAARVYRRKAAYAAAAVDWQTDGHRVNASQEAKAYLSLAEMYEMEAGVQPVRMMRGDVNVQ